MNLNPIPRLACSTVRKRKCIKVITIRQTDRQTDRQKTDRKEKNDRMQHSKVKKSHFAKLNSKSKLSQAEQN